MTTFIHHGTELLQMSFSIKQDMRSKLVMWLLQGCQTYGPRTKSGPLRGWKPARRM